MSTPLEKLKKEMQEQFRKERLKEYSEPLPTPTRERSTEELEERGRLVERIEGQTGSLYSIPWTKVSTKDMRQLLDALLYLRS